MTMESVNQSQIEEILRKIARLQNEMEYVKKNMIDVDCVLTDEEKNELEEARSEYERGETTSLEDFEKEMRLIHKKK